MEQLYLENGGVLMKAEERFAIVFEKLEQVKLQEGVTLTYKLSRETEEIRRLAEITTEVTRPKYLFITNA